MINENSLLVNIISQYKSLKLQDDIQNKLENMRLVNAELLQMSALTEQ